MPLFPTLDPIELEGVDSIEPSAPATETVRTSFLSRARHLYRARRDQARPYTRPVRRGCSIACWLLSAFSLIASLVTLISVLVSTRNSDLISKDEMLKSNFTFHLSSDQIHTEFSFKLSSTLNTEDVRNMYNSLHDDPCRWKDSSVAKLDGMMMMITSTDLDFDLTSDLSTASTSFYPGQLWKLPDSAGRFKLGVNLRSLPFLATRYLLVGRVLTGLDNLINLPASNSSVFYVNLCV